MKSLGKYTSSFLPVKQTMLHSSVAITCRVSGLSATSPPPHQAQPPVLKASSGMAQMYGLGLGCCENSHVGKRHVGSLVGSPSIPLESCFPSQLFPHGLPEPCCCALMLTLTLILTPTTDLASSASTSLGTCLPAAGWTVS